MDGNLLNTQRPWQRSEFWGSYLDALCNFIIVMMYVVVLYVVYGALGLIALIVTLVAMGLLLIPLLMYNKTWSKEYDAMSNQRKRYIVNRHPDDERGVIIES